MSYKEALEKINTAYVRELSASVLNARLKNLNALLGEKDLNQANRENAEALKFRLIGKLYALEYLKHFDAAVYEKLAEYIENARDAAREKAYKKTVAVLSDAQKVFKEAYGFINSINEVKNSLYYRGVKVAGASELSGALYKLTVISSEIEKREFENPFGENVAFLNIKAELKSYAESVIAEVNGLNAEETKRQLSGVLKDISDEFSLYEYYPLPDRDEGGRARATVVCTPLLDEAKLYATFARRSLAAENGSKKQKVKLYFLNCADLEGQDGGLTESVFAFLKTENADLLAAGAGALSAEKQRRFLRGAMLYGKAGGQTFIVDETGDAKLYSAAVAAAEGGGLSALDISRTYLSMPVYADVEEELKLKGMLCAASDYERLKKMPFAGFLGLNKLVQARVKGDENYWETGIKLSDKNFAKVKKYLSRLPSCYLLVDSGWGDFSKFDNRGNDGGHEFDYDGIKSVHLANVKKIMQSGESVFAKCGMLARYCTTGGGDCGEWQKLEREEMQARLELATKLVFRVLGVETVPEVKLLDGLENPGAGGLCVDGGKQVLYKYSSVCGDLAWTLGCVVHESFHALQSKLINGGWSQWYYDNMGITRGRVAEWRRTLKLYDGNTGGKVYKVHMYEGDAKAFEADCEEGRNYAWNGIEFEA